MTAASRDGGYVHRPAPSGLADVVDVLLDKGMVLDAYVQVSLLGLELSTIDTRSVIASLDTYLRFAEATNRLGPVEQGAGDDLPDLFRKAGDAGPGSDGGRDADGTDETDGSDRRTRRAPRPRPGSRAAGSRGQGKTQDQQ